MTRNPWQGRQARILNPVPDMLLPAAGSLWASHFGGRGACDPARGLVALGPDDRVLGVMGLRDSGGGFLRGSGGMMGWIYRPAPPSCDLVIDGIAVDAPRMGVGRALIDHASHIAGQRSFPGLRAEVRMSNPGALAFYAALGFVAEGAGRYGLPWWGQVHILRRDARSAEDA